MTNVSVSHIRRVDVMTFTQIKNKIEEAELEQNPSSGEETEMRINVSKKEKISDVKRRK